MMRPSSRALVMNINISLPKVGAPGQNLLLFSGSSASTHSNNKLSINDNNNPNNNLLFNSTLPNNDCPSSRKVAPWLMRGNSTWLLRGNSTTRVPPLALGTRTLATTSSSSPNTRNPSHGSSMAQHPMLPLPPLALIGIGDAILTLLRFGFSHFIVVS